MNRIFNFVLLVSDISDTGRWLECTENKDNINIHVINIIANNWIDQLKNLSPDAYLLKPPGINNTIKQIYDERVSMIGEMTDKLIYPSLRALRLFENKKYLYSWLKLHNIPHPNTYIFCNKADALLWVKSVTFPKVAKTNIGASGKGIKILRNQYQIESYIRQAFSKGILPNIGPNFRVGNIGNKLLKAFKSKMLVKNKLKTYKSILADRQRYVIFQDYIPHTYEWRGVLINNSYFAHKKLVTKSKASGSLLKNYDAPPEKVLDFIRYLTDCIGINSAAFDFFETSSGFYVNEIQAFFGQSDTYQMKVNNIIGRYLYKCGKWVFEPGDFNSNESYELRLNHVLSLLEEDS